MAALVIFSVDVRRLATFYEAVLGVTPVGESSRDIRLRSDSDEVLIHSVSASVAKKIHVATPPEPREGAAIKPVFEVESMREALASVRGHGGVITDFNFVLDGLQRHDVIDPDGNVIQLRCSTG
jgi:predicted enzyme related to lactoylglutathione lyase